MIEVAHVSRGNESTVEPRVDVVVISYNSGVRLRACVEPLSREPSIRVVVVDNASTDDTLSVLEGLPVVVVALDENVGFGGGCNVGWKAASAPLRLFPEPGRTHARGGRASPRRRPSADIGRGRCTADRRSLRRSRVVDPALPGRSLDLRAGNLCAPRVSERRLGRRGDTGPPSGTRAKRPATGRQARACSCGEKCSSNSAASTRGSSCIAKTSICVDGSGIAAVPSFAHRPWSARM